MSDKIFQEVNYKLSLEKVKKEKELNIKLDFFQTPDGLFAFPKTSMFYYYWDLYGYNKIDIEIYLDYKLTISQYQDVINKFSEKYNTQYTQLIGIED